MDPVGAWASGDFYRLGVTGSERRVAIPGSLHTFDLAMVRGELFAALGSSRGRHTLLRSRDEGRSWEAVSGATERILTLLPLEGELYAAPRFRAEGGSGLLRWDGVAFRATGLGTQQLLPGLPDTAGSIPRAEAFLHRLVYVGARGAVDWQPYALLAVHPPSPAVPIPLPEPGALPYDLLVRGDTLLVLAGVPRGDGDWEVVVYATDDLTHWARDVGFRAPTFARSFEEAGGDLFFGLGCGYRQPAAACGAVVRVALRDRLREAP
jgi:hypothetical protein